MNFDNLLEQVYLQDQLNEGFLKKYVLPAAAAVGLGIGTGHYKATNEQQPQPSVTEPADDKTVIDKQL